MTEKKPVFRHVDEFIFKQVDILKNSQPYQEAMRQMNNLNDLQLKVVNQAASIILVAIPLIIFIVILLVNMSMNANLETKRNILTEINSFTTAQKQLQSLGQNIISGAGLSSKKAFSNQVSGSISTAGSSRSNIRILDFESVPKDGILKANGVVRFSKLSTGNLSRFLADLVDRNKFRISNLLVKKNLKDNVVNGQVELLHYGRAPEDAKK